MYDASSPIGCCLDNIIVSLHIPVHCPGRMKSVAIDLRKQTWKDGRNFRIKRIATTEKSSEECWLFAQSRFPLSTDMNDFSLQNIFRIFQRRALQKSATGWEISWHKDVRITNKSQTVKWQKENVNVFLQNLSTSVYWKYQLTRSGININLWYLDQNIKQRCLREKNQRWCLRENSLRHGDANGRLTEL